MSDRGQEIGLYVTIEASQGAAERLRAVLAAVPVAAVLVRAVRDRAAARELAGIAQQAGAAALVEGDARLAVDLGCDGVHLPWSEDVLEAYAAARSIVGQARNVGAMAGTSRHDAMSLGEAGAEYIGFARAGGADVQAELVQWWAEVFEVPCVAFDVADAREAEQLARDGADFIGVTVLAGETVEAAVARIRQIAAAVGAGTGGGR